MLEVRNLCKSFGELQAVRDVGFVVEPGTCFGLLGHNGAGKSTTIEIIEGILEADSGEILYKGKKIDQSCKEEQGIMFQSTALQEHVSVKELLELFRALYAKGANLEDLIEKCDLSEILDRDNKNLSGGQKQKLLLALSLINNPNILFLDEPTTGLDPHARRRLWNLVENIKKEGTTIILTTHYMDEAYMLCDQIAIMQKGAIIAEGTPDSLLKERFKESIIEIPLQDCGDISTLKLNYSLKNQATVCISTENISRALRELLRRETNLDNMSIRSKNLEDLFIELTGVS